MIIFLDNKDCLDNIGAVSKSGNFWKIFPNFERERQKDRLYPT